jgi:hypothetical protein
MTEDVVEVVDAIQIESRVRIAGSTVAPGMHEVVVEHPFLIGLDAGLR